MRMRRTVVGLLVVAFGLAPATFAGNFGPGNSGSQGGKSPSEQKCHPPGQTTTEPGCK